MNKYLLFLITAGATLILSIITICIAPLINRADGSLEYFDNWNLANCKKLDDDYKYQKDNDYYNTPNVDRTVEEKIVKRRIKECKNHKIMFGFEYAAFIIDVVFGFICFLLGLLHYVEQGKPFEKTSGLIGLATGAIMAIITIIYVAFSASILSNEVIINKPILFKNKAYLQWNEGKQKYIRDFDEEKADTEDYDIKYVKYKDLGKIQYNYDTEFFRLEKVEKPDYFVQCQHTSNGPDPSGKISYGADKFCEYVWDTNINDLNDSSKFKFLYDRWITTIILGVIITLCGLALAFFGFLLFNNSGDSNANTNVNSPSPVPN